MRNALKPYTIDTEHGAIVVEPKPYGGSVATHVRDHADKATFVCKRFRGRKTYVVTAPDGTTLYKGPSDCAAIASVHRFENRS